MKIGYPCINKSIGCISSHTFRLRNYSEERLVETVVKNLACLENMLHYNISERLFFLRIGSDLIPFASHPVCTFNWQHYFSDQFKRLGDLITEHHFRISMHPDQYVLLNAKRSEVVDNSIKELIYHVDVLDAMELDTDAKIQIHVGGMYGNKRESMERFTSVYKSLPQKVIARLAIEHDDRIFTFRDCVDIHEQTGIPVIFDNLHHQANCSGEDLQDVFNILEQIWGGSHGTIMTDYSEQKPGGRPGKHDDHINIKNFSTYLENTAGYDFDIMFEIKDKEPSALIARDIIESL